MQKILSGQSAFQTEFRGQQARELLFAMQAAPVHVDEDTKLAPVRVSVAFKPERSESRLGELLAGQIERLVDRDVRVRS